MNRSAKRTAVLSAAVAVSGLLGSEAPVFAQDATVGVGANTTLSTKGSSGSASAGASENSRTETVRERAPSAPTTNEHEAVVGHLGVGWMGTRDVPVGPTTGAGTPAIPTPVVGARYWLSSMLGIDAGIGFITTSSSTRLTPANTTTDGPSRTAFVIQAGVPIALADTSHFAFLITPQLALGFGTGKGTGTPASDLTGTLVEGGVKAGAEVFFGFMGLPQLSLEGGLGVFFSSASGKISQGGGSTRHSEFTIATSSVAQPWDFFRKDLAARYYF